MQGLSGLVLGDDGDRVIHPYWISRVLTGRLKPCWNKGPEFTVSHSFQTKINTEQAGIGSNQGLIPPFKSSDVILISYERVVYSSGTLYSGWADDEGLLEGFSLSAQLRVSGLEWNTLLRQTRDVDGSLLVQTRLVVEQRNVAAQRQRLAARGRHLLKDKAEVVMGVALKKASDLIATEYKKIIYNIVLILNKIKTVPHF